MAQRDTIKITTKYNGKEERTEYTLGAIVDGRHISQGIYIRDGVESEDLNLPTLLRQFARSIELHESE